jgi:radical SAM protein with 4Fe4S-binding SPASM domain
MIDNNEAVCVFPKGELGICEHYLESKFIGHIDNPNEKNWDVIKGWRKYMEPIELCKDCPIKPGCLKVIGCPDEITCFKAK